LGFWKKKPAPKPAPSGPVPEWIKKLSFSASTLKLMREFEDEKAARAKPNRAQ
jgi:hypothetical protein